MMAAFILISLLLSLLMLSGILFQGYRHVFGAVPARSNPHSSSPETDLKDTGSHNVAVIIPVTGISPDLKDNLESFLSQDFRHYRTYLVTSDHRDPAVPIVRELVSEKNNAHHITAGHAVHCGQKNFNLLAGVKAAGEDFDILVFFDSSHLAPPTVLSDLLKPLFKEGESMTTGFHRVLPGDFRISTLGMMFSVLAIHLLQGNPNFVQPWGGATAILRSVFVDHRIDQLWSRTVVDDFSMGPKLRKKGIKCKAVPTACLITPLTAQDLGGWVSWLTRQIQYMRFYTPWLWLSALLAAYLLAAPTFLSIISFSGFFFGYFSFKIVTGCVLYFVIWLSIGLWTRKKVLKNSPILNWLWSYYLTHLVATWCYIKTWFKNTIDWRGISYKMASNGRVMEIIPDKTLRK